MCGHVRMMDCQGAQNPRPTTRNPTLRGHRWTAESPSAQGFEVKAPGDMVPALHFPQWFNATLQHPQEYRNLETTSLFVEDDLKIITIIRSRSPYNYVMSEEFVERAVYSLQNQIDPLGFTKKGILQQKIHEKS